MKKIFFLIMITFLSFTVVMAQLSSYREMQSKADRFFGPPVFLFDIFYFQSATDKAMTRTEINIGFCNDLLQFVKSSADLFSAKYELSIVIFDKKGNHLNGKTFTDEIEVKSFQETNLRKITNRLSHSVELVANQYKLVIELTDLDTKKTLHREKLLDIHLFKFDEIGVSDIVFADKIEKTEKGLISFTSNLSRNFNESESDFAAYFEIYPVNSNDSLTLTYNILDATERLVVNEKVTLFPNKNIIPYVVNLGEQISLASRYTLNVEVNQTGSTDKNSGKFSTSWSYFEVSHLNVQQAIKPLKEYVSHKDWKTIEQGSDSLRESWFREYWTKRDPTPDTEENELMDEFYDRVEFANFYFTVNTVDKDGWETDRGEIYIKYGQPTSVDRHINDLNVPPYEIWFYSNLERRFIFEDRSGYGEYTLVKIE